MGEDAELRRRADGAGAAFERLTAIMKRLRDPERGCPWDVRQTYKTIAPYTIEEAYEVADAIERGDREDLCEELGDLALQVVFHSQIAAEEGAFDAADALNAVSDKMVRRHPHVFDGADGWDWEAIKAEEKARKAAKRTAAHSLLDDVPTALPALTRAEKLTKRAARVGFDWPSADQAMAKLDEELAEFSEAQSAGDPDAMEDEFGDVLFVLANVARKLQIDPEAALRRANAKFNRRFRAIEAALAAEGRSADDADLEEMEALWVEAKRAEKTAP